MDHISDGIKWPSEQQELLFQQTLVEWQAVAARQEKNQKDCVDSLAALRVQQEVVWAKQEEQALLERRDLVNKLTSNPRAVQEELALSQREAVIAEQVVIAELLAKGAEDNAVLLHWFACALQLAAPARPWPARHSRPSRPARSPTAAPSFRSRCWTAQSPKRTASSRARRRSTHARVARRRTWTSRSNRGIRPAARSSCARRCSCASSSGLHQAAPVFADRQRGGVDDFDLLLDVAVIDGASAHGGRHSTE